ncbi:MAG: hypothetical protein V1728_01680 [Candidatus Micrarchaeota archaeon]
MPFVLQIITKHKFPALPHAGASSEIAAAEPGIQDLMMRQSVKSISLSGQLKSALATLMEGNREDVCKRFLAAIERMPDRQKADFCDMLHQINKSFAPKGAEIRTEVQRVLLYQLACATAPAWAAREADLDLGLGRAEFHIKYGKYDPNVNNCLQYACYKYYEALSPFFPESLKDRISKRKIHGQRPANFIFNSKALVGLKPDELAKDYEKRSEAIRSGGQVVFVEYTYTAKDIRKHPEILKESLQTGDLVGVDLSPRTPNPHWGICDSDGNIVNIAKPLADDTLEKFIRRAGKVRPEMAVRIRRLVHLDASDNGLAKYVPKKTS